MLSTDILQGVITNIYLLKHSRDSADGLHYLPGGCHYIGNTLMVSFSCNYGRSWKSNLQITRENIG